VLAFLLFGVLFSWLASRSGTYSEDFGEVFLETGIWSGLVFGIILGAVFAWLLRPRAVTYAIAAPTAFRARLMEVLPKVRLQVLQEAGDEILLRPAKRPALPILKEETVLVAIAPTGVTITGGRMTVGRLRRRLGLR
jgi:hypothetical protein